MAKIVFKKLVAHNFFSFADISLDLDKENSFLVLGENNDGDGFERNGAGKSGIREALRWALFNDVIRDILAKDVIRRGQKECCVKLIYFSDGDEVVVTRKRGVRMSLSVQCHGVTSRGKEAQKLIEDTLGVDALTFTNLVLLTAEYKKLFALATDAECKDILWQLISNMDFSALRDEVIKKRRAFEEESMVLDTRAIELDVRLDETETKQVEVQNTIVVHKKNKKQYTKEVKIKELEIGELDTQVKKLKAEIKLKMAAGDEAKVDMSKKVNDLLEEKKKAEVGNKRRVDDAHNEATNLLAKASSINAKVKYAVTERDELQDLIDVGKCPTCGQETTISDFEDKAEKYVEEIRDLNLEELDIRQRYDLANEQAQNLSFGGDAASAAFDERIKDGMDSLSEMTVDVSVEENQLEYAEGELEVSKEALSTAQSELMFVTRDLKRITKDKLELVEELQRLLEETKIVVMRLGELDEAISDYMFWDKGFSPKGIPSLLIEVTLPKLNVAIQKYADTLSGGMLQVKLEAYEETSTGSVREAIRVQATNASGADTYGGDSLGERRRIDIAVMLGLIEYFRSVGAFSCNLLFVDEVLDNLDAVGISLAIVALDESGVAGRFVVSHEQELQSLFGSTILVSKTGGVSSIKVLAA